MDARISGDAKTGGVQSREGQMLKVRATAWIAEEDLSIIRALVTEFRERQEKPKKRKRKGRVGMRGARTHSKGVGSQI